MKTIAENLQILKDSSDAIKQAIIDKGGKITGGLSSYADAISKIGANKEKKDVVFYDYDGIILHSYTKDDFLALTALPPLPSRSGLVCQGWNWTLEDAKEYGRLDIGATYITDDNKTRLYINLLNDGISVPIYINQTIENGVIVDWGDGSDSETISGTGNMIFNHTYNKAGSYIISLKVETGTCTLGRNSSSYNVMGNYDTIPSGSLYKVEIGSNIGVGNNAFQYCYSLQSVTIPNSVTSVGECAFQRCYSLQSVTIPNSVTSVGEYAFRNCYSLSSITIPNSVTSGVYAFMGCSSLTSITIPNSVTSIGEKTFQNCHSLQSVTIPNSVTSVGEYVFARCFSMQYYDFTSHTSIPTLSNTNAFGGISSGCEIRVPAALYNDWVNATNWSNYANYIVPYNENGNKVSN